MLRYGIPEYRLPKEILKREVDLIQQVGVVFRNNSKPTVEQLSETHDAVIVAIGAWSSSALRCKGEELEGVVGGIDFLREPFDLSGKVAAVVGGGNTAMDACRSAVRMGAETVYCVYRRTRDEMPAQAVEITEAMEEGVIFKFLTNPKEIIGTDGKVTGVLLTVMELGEPDDSGRRCPIETDKTETIKVDYVFAAIGQKPNLDKFESLQTTKWGTIAADEKTFRVSVKNAVGAERGSPVFAIGDATNNGADIAVTAIGEGKRCAEVVNRFLQGETPETMPFYTVKDEKTAADFTDVPKAERVKVNHREPLERAKDFKEVYTIFDEESAKREASRCLECGCSAYRDRDCKLLKYAHRYGVNPDRYGGFMHSYRVSTDDHDKIRRNPEKCILCGLCVRVCEEVEELTVLGFHGRGFDTMVKPALGKLLKNTKCNACNKCADICPTGAMGVKT
jgi:formate dehydrogenase major subunit